MLILTFLADRVFRVFVSSFNPEELVSTKWVLAIIRVLLDGPSRFSRLREEIPGVSANILTDRLRYLEISGVVRRELMPEPASRQVYTLTEHGREARSVLDGIDHWSRSWATSTDLGDTKSGPAL